jgi:hypothetical protein
MPKLTLVPADDGAISRARSPLVAGIHLHDARQRRFRQRMGGLTGARRGLVAEAMTMPMQSEGPLPVIVIRSAFSARGAALWRLAGRSAMASTANVWLDGNYIAAPGQVNGIAATTDTFRISGVVVLAGNEAPSAERAHYIMRPFDQELVLCKRHLQILKGGNGQYLGAMQAFTTTNALGPVWCLPVEMRVAPSASISAVGHMGLLNAGTTTVPCTSHNFMATPTVLYDSVAIGTASFTPPVITQAILTAGSLKLDARL